MASVKDNVANSKKFAALVTNDKSLGWVGDLFADNHRFHDAAVPGLPAGPAGIRQFLQLYIGAFPDLTLTVNDAFGAGNKVVTRWTAVGTNTGPVMGNPPTGKRVTVEGMTVDWYDAGGKISESWNSWDTAGYFAQLGLGAEASAPQAQPEQRPGVQ
jgi:steroid delta-isomerase-like uncharacterized protein